MHNIDQTIVEIENKTRPKPHRRTKHPCSICNKSVRDTQDGLQCDTCNLWSHASCNDISKAQYLNLSYDNSPWYCLICNLKFNLENVAFTRCNISEIEGINNSNTMRFL